MNATAIDPRALRDTLGCYATGVAVITARTAEAGDVGVTVNSFASLSLDPPLVLFSIAKTSNSLAALRQAGYFAINILSHGQRALSSAFAKPSTADFAQFEHHRSQAGPALFDDALAQLECRNAQQLDGGDHVIFIGHVDAAHKQPQGEPLLFFKGRYEAVAPAMEIAIRI